MTCTMIDLSLIYPAFQAREPQEVADPEGWAQLGSSWYQFFIEGMMFLYVFIVFVVYCLLIIVLVCIILRYVEDSCLSDLHQSTVSWFWVILQEVRRPTCLRFQASGMTSDLKFLKIIKKIKKSSWAQEILDWINHLSSTVYDHCLIL